MKLETQFDEMGKIVRKFDEAGNLIEGTWEDILQNISDKLSTTLEYLRYSRISLHNVEIDEIHNIIMDDNYNTEDIETYFDVNGYERLDLD